MKLNTYKISFITVKKPEVIEQEKREKEEKERRSRKNNNDCVWCDCGIDYQLNLFSSNKEHIFITSHTMSEAVKYAEEHLAELTKDMKFNKKFNIDGGIEEVELEHETTII